MVKEVRLPICLKPSTTNRMVHEHCKGAESRKGCTQKAPRSFSSKFGTYRVIKDLITTIFLFCGHQLLCQVIQQTFGHTKDLWCQLHEI